MKTTPWKTPCFHKSYENPMKINDFLGVPPIFGNLYIKIYYHNISWYLMIIIIYLMFIHHKNGIFIDSIDSRSKLFPQWSSHSAMNITFKPWLPAMGWPQSRLVPGVQREGGRVEDCARASKINFCDGKSSANGYGSKPWQMGTLNRDFGSLENSLIRFFGKLTWPIPKR